jgi:hypothetical protein
MSEVTIKIVASSGHEAVMIVDTSGTDPRITELHSPERDATASPMLQAIDLRMLLRALISRDEPAETIPIAPTKVVRSQRAAAEAASTHDEACTVVGLFSRRRHSDSGPHTAPAAGGVEESSDAGRFAARCW